MNLDGIFEKESMKLCKIEYKLRLSTKMTGPLNHVLTPVDVSTKQAPTILIDAYLKEVTSIIEPPTI
ncbi:MAG: hypothetical protein MRT15_11275 [archaeon YNP-LCB-003-016]|jgi:hypothetical protein|nr:hypothetical protein [Candidatus Culexarchaeum yellowstonense]